VAQVEATAAKFDGEFSLAGNVAGLLGFMSAAAE
jgi:hypothetical protein